MLTSRSTHPEAFLGKGVLKICSKFTIELPCQNAISIKLESNVIEITLWHGFSAVNLLHIFRTTFLKNTSGWLLPKTAIKTPEPHQWRLSSVFIVNFEHIPHIFLVFGLFTLSMYLFRNTFFRILWVSMWRYYWHGLWK